MPERVPPLPARVDSGPCPRHGTGRGLLDGGGGQPLELAIGTHPDGADRLLAEAAGELTMSRLAFGVGQGDCSSTGQIDEDVIVRIEIAATWPR